MNIETMNIIHLATELAPIAKVGGLADVVYGLAKHSLKHGHQVEIVLPKYDCIDYSSLKNLKAEYPEIWSYDGPYKYHNTLWSAKLDNLQIWLLESQHPAYFYNRGKIYGCPDDIDRFVYFSRAALEFLFKTGRKPDVLHLHDWPTAASAPLYKEMYASLGYRVGGTLLTIHNLEHQGKCLPQNLTRAGLRGEDYLTPEKMQDPYQPTLINLLKGGIEYADFITTVSPNYEKEIQTPQGGCGLNTVLTRHQNKLKGILNGIDTEYWNPEFDPLLACPYNLMNVAHGKSINKKKVCERFGLKESSGPLICSITRLVPQKGPALIKHACERTLEKGGQFVLLGAVPSPEIDKEFRQLQKQLSKTKNAAFHFEYDEPLAHLVYAAADMIIIPSIFEPCGLTQMIAMRYGTVPIVRATGGLKDTVVDGKNGFTFDFPDNLGVNWALDRALETFMKDPEAWKKLVFIGMSENFSWEKPFQAYQEIYAHFVKKKSNDTFEKKAG
jgi:starch synthase